MIGTRHVTTAALALGAILLATTALQGAYAQARGEGLPPSADSRITPNLADTADADEAEPNGRGQTGPFVTGSNPDGDRARFTGQPRPGVPYPDTAAPSKTGKQPAPYAAQRYPGGAPSPTAANQPSPRPSYAGDGYLPPSAGKQPTPGGYGDPGSQGGAKTAPYKQQPNGVYADTNAYQGGYQGRYGDDQGGYGHQGADCP